ncbi:hypothetical protein EYF80_019771 [Liparis tanakae]|uniref:Uncharacterized protein n=1 Tax=Liparis tanakae TaxID=230148 RepID=A0A4Z2HXN2_9TELE|nr:hypothetical protein EYF80_019771 [Liparis tanakae]
MTPTGLEVQRDRGPRPPAWRTGALVLALEDRGHRPPAWRTGALVLALEDRGPRPPAWRTGALALEDRGPRPPAWRTGPPTGALPGPVRGPARPASGVIGVLARFPVMVPQRSAGRRHSVMRSRSEARRVELWPRTGSSGRLSFFCEMLFWMRLLKEAFPAERPQRSPSSIRQQLCP